MYEGAMGVQWGEDLYGGALAGGDCRVGLRGGGGGYTGQAPLGAASTAALPRPGSVPQFPHLCPGAGHSCGGVSPRPRSSSPGPAEEPDGCPRGRSRDARLLPGLGAPVARGLSAVPRSRSRSPGEAARTHLSCLARSPCALACVRVHMCVCLWVRLCACLCVCRCACACGFVCACERVRLCVRTCV